MLNPPFPLGLSSYLVSMDKRDLAKDSPAYLGKLRSNFLGTEYTLFDSGESPDGDGAGGRTGGGGTELRQELGVVFYAPNVLGARGPRKMRVAVPKALPDGRRVPFQPEKDEDSMANKFRAGHTQDLYLMVR